MIPAVFQDEASLLEPQAVQDRWVDIEEDYIKELTDDLEIEKF